MTKTHSKRTALVIVTLSSFMSTFTDSSIEIALPTISNELALDAVVLSWITTSSFLASAMFLVPFGRIADIYGRKRLYTYGVIVFTNASLLVALSNTALVLLIARIIQGIGSAMIFATVIAILTSIYPTGERGKVLGINVMAVYLGLTLGPILGGFLTQYVGWRSIFGITVSVGLILIMLTFWKLRDEWAEARGEKFDLIGSIIYGLTLLVLMYGFSLLPAKLGVWFLLMGIAGIVIFISYEIRVDTPVLDIRIFRKNRVFAFANLTALIYFTATHAVTFLLSLYLQYIRELSPQRAGLILIALTIVQASFSPIAGRLSDRIAPQRVIPLGLIGTAVGLLLLTQLNATTSLEFIITSLAILGLGAALFSSPNTNAVMGSVERKVYGVASGTRGTVRLIGQMLNMGIVMLLFTVYMGRVQITRDVYPLFISSIQVAFIISTLLCVVAIFTSLVRNKTP